MKSEIFRDWLLEFGKYISQFRERRIGLIVSNVSCCEKSTDRIRLKNIEIFYLPTNATSQTQPFDSGVIALMKRRFKREQARQTLQVIDKKKNDIYNIDLYTVCT